MELGDGPAQTLPRFGPAAGTGSDIARAVALLSLAEAGHRAYASVRAVDGRNRGRAVRFRRELRLDAGAWRALARQGAEFECDLGSMDSGIGKLLPLIQDRALFSRGARAPPAEMTSIPDGA